MRVQLRRPNETGATMNRGKADVYGNHFSTLCCRGYRTEVEKNQKTWLRFVLFSNQQTSAPGCCYTTLLSAAPVIISFLVISTLSRHQ